MEPVEAVCAIPAPPVSRFDFGWLAGHTDEAPGKLRSEAPKGALYGFTQQIHRFGMVWLVKLT
jgi:hypothetical protein